MVVIVVLIVVAEAAAVVVVIAVVVLIEAVVAAAVAVVVALVMGITVLALPRVCCSIHEQIICFWQPWRETFQDKCRYFSHDTLNRT